MSAWPAVLEQLMRERRPGLVGYATLMTGDRTKAEDLVHDAIIKSFSKGRGFSHVNQADAYVRRAIATTFLDLARRDVRMRERLPQLHDEDAVTTDPSAAVEVSRALATLPPQERACIVLRYFDDLTVPQIATQLHLKPGTVKRYVHDGLAKLSSVLDIDPDAAPTPTATITATERVGR